MNDSPDPQTENYSWFCTVLIFVYSKHTILLVKFVLNIANTTEKCNNENY